MNAGRWLLEHGAETDLAFVHQDRRWTYEELRARAHGVARDLAAHGVAPGDRVALLAPNSPELAAVLLGIMLAGATAVPLPASDPPARLAGMLARAKAVAIYAEGRAAETAKKLSTARVFDAVPRGEPIDAAETTAPALVLFTSGSTGEPRGVMLSHANLVANTTSILASLPIRADDRMMVVLPFYYSYGASLLFTHLRIGARLVLNNGFMFADRVLEEMVREECTAFAGVPSTFQILLRRSSLTRMTFPSLRYVQQAGGRLAPSFVAELRAALPTSEVWLMYGQTEATARLAVLHPSRLDDKSHTIGKAIAGVALAIEDGELVARGENIALGYLDEAAATAETFRDGLRTGDLGHVDDEGFFVLVDRAKDFLKCAGYRVGMREIEDVLVGFAGTVEAAVVGIPDDLQGEAVEAWVVHPDADAARPALETYCKRSLAPHIQPRSVVFVDALPKTAAGKLARADLRALSRARRES